MCRPNPILQRVTIAFARSRHISRSATEQPVVITQRGRPAAVMLSLEAYERSEQERQILEILARGEREIAAGKGHDLDDVLAEADRRMADLEP